MNFMNYLYRFVLLSFLLLTICSAVFFVANAREACAEEEVFSPPAKPEMPINAALISLPRSEWGESKLAEYIAGDFAHMIYCDVKIPQDWHLYSVTQIAGGPMRTEFSLTREREDAAPEELPTIRAIFPVMPPQVESESVFGVPIESHAGEMAWIILLTETATAESTAESFALKLEGQICNEGLGGMCVQVEESVEVFTKLITTLDLPKIFSEINEVPAQFVWDAAPRVSSTSSENTSSAQNSAPTSQQFNVTELEEVTSLGGAIFWAFLGGIILNVMPCVLPVIGLKILSFFQQAGESRARALWLNVCYTFGLLTVFSLLATMSVGLSYLFTFDIFNIVMAVVVFAMALSLMGIWELMLPSFLTGRTSSKLMDHEGAGGAYFKGIITTLLAIPCGAPLLSPALSWASMQIEAGQTASVFVVYMTIGLGMASPFLVMGAFPELLRFLPKPGAWMETFRQVMGFCLLIAVVWVLYFINLAQIVPTIALLFVVWFFCWMLGKLDYTTPTKIWRRTYFMGILLCGITVVGVFDFDGNPNHYTLQSAMQARIARLAPTTTTTSHWKPFTDEQLARGLQQGKIVLVDFTADWCLNCKVLEATVLESQEVIDFIEQENLVALQADCTRRDFPGAKLLRSLGVESVPALAIFRPESPNAPFLIRGNYSAATLIKNVKK